MAAEGRAWIEVALETGRRGRIPSRRVALYAFADAAACWKFLTAQQSRGIGVGDLPSKIYLYEIDMPEPRCAPMAVVGRFEKLGIGHPAIPKVVEEYWNPSSQWHYLEYLDATFTVRGSVPAPTKGEVERATDRYRSDWLQARSLFPES